MDHTAPHPVSSASLAVDSQSSFTSAEILFLLPGSSPSDLNTTAGNLGHKNFFVCYGTQKSKATFKPALLSAQLCRAPLPISSTRGWKEPLFSKASRTGCHSRDRNWA